jgi:hypothetical protein
LSLRSAAANIDMIDADQERIVMLRLSFMSSAAFVVCALFSTNTWACKVPAPAAHPLPKTGSCPSGYSTSGKYCKPSSSSARFAMQKVRSCASGYHTSGGYCLASSARSCHAMVKSGSCPSGYHTSGGYCLSS